MSRTGAGKVREQSPNEENEQMHLSEWRRAVEIVNACRQQIKQNRRDVEGEAGTSAGKARPQPPISPDSTHQMLQKKLVKRGEMVKRRDSGRGVF